jgi:membrane protein involved in colicin uptake
MADTPTGETVTPEAPSNKVTPVAAPAANAIDPAELERLKKDQEKKDFRIRQLENEAAAAKKAEEERQAKELEQNQEFKTLHEQEKAKRLELEDRLAAEEKRQDVDKAAAAVLKDYNNEVKALAKDLGLQLSDDSEEAVADFKSKLDAAAKRIGVAKVTPNNPSAPSRPGQATGPELRAILADPAQRDAYMREHYPVTAAMMAPVREA